MRPLLVVISTLFLAVSINPQTVWARDKKQSPYPTTFQAQYELSNQVARRMPGGPFRASTVEETTFLATFTFDQGPNCVTEGWTSHDLSAQLDDYWHVDDFDGLGGGSYGRLFPLEGSKSLWCGTRPGTDPNTCAYSTPGYGNAWDQNFCTRICVPVSGDVTVDYLVSWDVEPGYDYGYLEYDECNDDWRHFDTPVVYNGTGTGFVSDTLLAGSHSGQIRLRFNVTSDGAWSDHDGLWETDGALILDSLTVSDGTGVVVATELFEDEAVGDTGSDDWVTCNVSGYGDFAQLYPGINTLQKDPCRQEYSCLWDFVKGSPYDYSCGGHAAPGGRALRGRRGPVYPQLDPVAGDRVNG